MPVLFVKSLTEAQTCNVTSESLHFDCSLVILAVVVGVRQGPEFIDAEFLSAGERVDVPPAQFLKTLKC